MQYTAKKIQFIKDSIICFIQAKDQTEADIRRTIMMFLNTDSDFFSDTDLEELEQEIAVIYHGETATEEAVA